MSTSLSYDSNGYLQSRTDFNGNSIKYAYDSTRSLETQRIEAYGTPSARTTNTTWNANFHVPNQRSVVNASSVTESLTKWTYNTRGQVLSRCEIDPAVSGASSYTCGSSTNAPAGVRQTTYTYCEQAGVTANTCPLIGLVLTVDGPRTDVSDATTYTYYETNDLSGCATIGGACHNKGDLLQATNALGQSTTYISYDKNGRVTRQSDTNGTLIDFTYHPRGWLLTHIVRANVDGSASSNDATTTFDYDNVGQVKKITQPDGAYLAYTYDAAHRLTDITDNLSNTIHYTLDAVGNRKNEETKDPTNVLTRALSREYDQLNRLIKTFNAASVAVQTYQNPAEASPTGVTYTNGYDGNGNAIYSVDSNGVGTEQQYDPLNRLVKTLQDHAGTGTTKDARTQYAYDARDNLRSVSDPDGLITTYTFDGLNNLTRLQSSDTGTTAYGYDAAGNRTSQTDARGVMTSYQYDALNRLTKITYPTSSLNVAYRYDEPDSTTGCSGSAPIGHLTTMTDSSGSTTYCYDSHGNLTQTTQAVDGQSLTTQYLYSVADRLNFLIYPSGDVVGYDRDAAGRTVVVTFMAGDPMPLVSGVSYSPFGPANTITFANGRTLTKTYDRDYAISTIASSDPNGLALTAQVDALGNLTRATLPGATRTYAYDPLYRLTAANDGNNVSVESYTYNLTGDRTSKTLSGAGQAYAYTAPLTSHRLQSVAGSGRTYDATGNTTQIGSTTFTYDDRNRLTAANGANYLYNGKGERVVKRVGTQDTIFTYGPGGNLLAEYASPFSCNNPNFFNCDPNFNGLSWPTEYLWLDDTLIGVVRNGNPYYVETDQLGTPRKIIQPGYPSNDPDYGDKVVWSWDYAASTFGENAPDQDPTNSGNPFVMNLRFPGQYYDAETGLYFNNARYYDKDSGRYIQSDPIGLDGGDNTYLYADANPLVSMDPSGEGPIKLIKLCVKGYRILRPATFKEAVKAARRGEDVLASSHKEAKQIARAASDSGKYATRDAAHGEDYMPHYHPEPRTGAHVFYQIAAGLTLEHYACSDCFSGKLAWVGDFFNPLSTPQDVIDIVDLINGDDEE